MSDSANTPHREPVADLEFALSQVVIERISEGQWRVIAIAGDASLRPIEAYLREQFGIVTPKRYGIVLVEIQPSAGGAVDGSGESRT